MFFQRALGLALQYCSSQCYTWFLLLIPAVNSSQTTFTVPGVARAFQKAKGFAWAGWQCCPQDWTQGWVRRVSTLLSWALLQPSPAKGTRGSHQVVTRPLCCLQTCSSGWHCATGLTNFQRNIQQLPNLPAPAPRCHCCNPEEQGTGCICGRCQKPEQPAHFHTLREH